MNNRKKHLHPGARWLFRLGGISIAVFFAFVFSWVVVPILGVLVSGLGEGSGSVIALLVLGFVFLIVFLIVVAEIYARMTYNRWFYEFGDNSLKLERGIIWKKYSNVPYERVQNVDIHRGIIARLVGFSSVAIQTAGISYTPRGGAGAEGSIPAVSVKEAEEIREFLMDKITKKSRSQGM